nr:hypothetical protein [Tanacetum cinerariifolium]
MWLIIFGYMHVFRFWRTVAIKSSNDVTRLQALVDKKRVVVTEAAIRDALHLDDAEGVDCLPSEEIFTELARKGCSRVETSLFEGMIAAKEPENQVSAAAVIPSVVPKTISVAAIPTVTALSIKLVASVKADVPSTIQKKEWLSGIQKRNHLQKLLLKPPPRTREKEAAIDHVKQRVKEEPFIQRYQVMKKMPQTEAQARRNMMMYLKNTVGFTLDYFKGMSYDDIRLIFMAKFNANMEFLLKSKEQIEEEESRAIATINKTLVQKAAKRRKLIEEAKEAESIKKHLQIVPDEDDDVFIEATPLARKVPVVDYQRGVTIMEDVSNPRRMIDELDRDEGVVLMSKKEEKKAEEVKDITDELEVQEAVEVVTTTKLITKVVAAVSETVSVAAVVPTVTTAPVKVVVLSTRRRRGVVIRDPEKESSVKTPSETKSKDKGKVQGQGKTYNGRRAQANKKKQQVEIDEAYARKLHEELNQDIDWEVAINHVKQKAKENPYVQRLDYFKGMSYDDIRLIFEAKFNSNIEFLLKFKEQLEEEENKEIESINETPAQKEAKRRRLNEEAEDVEELKQHLEIVPDEDDDVYTEATPLARKVSIMDYQIIQLNNKPYIKIIRADGTHQLYVSFITLLKNFDKEELESLWSIVKERFSTSKPNNFLDNFLLTTLRAMFGRPDGQDQVWMSQKSVHGQAKIPTLEVYIRSNAECSKAKSGKAE